MPIFVCLWAYIMCLVVGSFDRSWLGTGYGSNLYFIFYKFSLFFVVLLALVSHFRILGNLEAHRGNVAERVEDPCVSIWKSR